MTLAKPLAAGLFAAAAVFALVHCGDEPTDNTNTTTETDAGCDPKTDPTCPECEADEDCGDPAQWTCSVADGRCHAACTSRSQCQAHEAASGGPLPECTGKLGCVCDERKCLAQLCTADSECGGTMVCKNGQCTQPEVPDSCKVFPDYAVLRQGKTATFTAVAYKGGAPVVAAPSTLTWSAAGASVTGGTNGVFTGGTPSTGTTAAPDVKASFGGVSCTAKVLVLGAPTAGTVRVTVVDELTGRLITGAKVQVTPVATGTPVLATEDATIKGTYSAASATAATIGVFHQDFAYVTIVNTLKNDLYIPLRRHAGDKVGGYQGKFLNMSQTNDVHLGIAGTSIPGSLTDLDLSVLVGPTQNTHIVFSGQSADVPLPSGVTLALGNNKFKEPYQAVGLPGTCDTEADVVGGDCGTRSAWAVAGDIPLKAIPIAQLTGGTSNLNIGSLLASLLPQFKSFKSNIARDVTFKAKAPPSGDVTKLFTDTSAFVPLDLDVAKAVPLTLKSTVAVPALPTANGKQLDSALVLAGSIVKGRGVVPLGLTAGIDTDSSHATANGLVIGEAGNDDGKLTLRLAPNHDGTEGSKYGVVSLALSISGFTGGERLAMAGLVQTLSAIEYGKNITYTTGFPAFGDQGSYDFKTGKFTGGRAITNAVTRMVFTNADGHKWVVYFTGTSFDLPAPPSGMEDRTMWNTTGTRSNTATEERASFSIQVLNLANGTAAIDRDALAEFNDTNIENVVEYTQAFSVYDFGRPTISITEPAAGATVSAGATYKAKVADLPAGAKVQFRALQGTTEVKTAAGTAPSTAGESTAAFTGLAAGAYTIEARVVKSDGTTPEDPVVHSTINVTVQ